MQSSLFPSSTLSPAGPVTYLPPVPDIPKSRKYGIPLGLVVTSNALTVVLKENLPRIESFGVKNWDNLVGQFEAAMKATLPLYETLLADYLNEANRDVFYKGMSEAATILSTLRLICRPYVEAYVEEVQKEAHRLETMVSSMMQLAEDGPIAVYYQWLGILRRYELLAQLLWAIEAREQGDT